MKLKQEEREIFIQIQKHSANGIRMVMNVFRRIGLVCIAFSAYGAITEDEYVSMIIVSIFAGIFFILLPTKIYNNNEHARWIDVLQNHQEEVYNAKLIHANIIYMGGPYSSKKNGGRSPFTKRTAKNSVF